MTWDGRERRKMNTDDHDLLIKIDANLSNHFEVMETHMLDDKVAFKKINEDMEWVKKVLYGGVGIIIFIELLAKVVN